jgi:hypothetical protein
MTSHSTILSPLARIALGSLLLLILTSPGQATAQWSLVLPPEMAEDAAISAAVEDLTAAAEKFGIDLRTTSAGPEDSRILVGTPDQLRSLGVPEVPLPPDHPQGFTLSTVSTPEGGVDLLVVGQTLPGCVNGLYWIWDRLRVHGHIPALDESRQPVGDVRLAGGASREEIRNALRYSCTWVSNPNSLDWIPWEQEPQASQNADNRKAIQKLIEAAHDYHLKFLATGDEISYLPAFLEEQGATTHPEDPKLWEALQEKYRMLFRALPDLDGVQIRTGELTRVYGDYRPYDVMHDPPDPEWPLEKRYRKFLQTLHEVVVGEYGKIYFHRTWATSAFEQHSDPAVYKAIFTGEVPTENLYLSPYLSLADRWYYQPYNPTFNLTPHRMLILFSTLDYHAHAGVKVFPSFPGQYHQGGLEQVLAAPDTNLAGAHFAAPDPEEWSTRALTGYTVFCLMWEPHLDLRQIAEDYAAIHVGREAAPVLAEILLLSYEAYKDGIYVKPVAEKIRGNTQPHLRLTSFKRWGVPEIDRGRGHLDWLRTTLYEPSLGETEEAEDLLDRGLEAALKMKDLYAEVEASVTDPALAREIGDSLDLTHGLVATNNAYIKTVYDLFDYLGHPGEETETELASQVEALRSQASEFREAPNFVYDLAGVDQTLDLATRALEDLPRFRGQMAKAPASEELPGVIEGWVESSDRFLETHRDKATKILRWRGRVDGRDILRLKGGRAWIEHIEADEIQDATLTFFQHLPAEPRTLLVRDIESPEADPFILEQPEQDNDYTASVYLFDRIPSYSWWEFEVYLLEENPSENGMLPPWGRDPD